MWSRHINTILLFTRSNAEALCPGKPGSENPGTGGGRRSQKVELEMQKEQKQKEMTDGTIKAILGVLGLMVFGVLYLFVYALAYDPMLVAVLEDGSWICVHSWWD